MCQLMRHHRLLAFQLQPISQVKLPAFRIVIAGHLFSQELDNKRPILKVAGGKAKLPKRNFGGMHFRCAYLFVEVIDQHSLNLSSRLCPLFTGLRIGSSLISLVSFNTSVVAATMAALRVVLLATVARWGVRRRADCFAVRANIPRIETAIRATNRLVCFDIVGLPLL